MSVEPCPYRARALWGEHVVADTDDAVIVDTGADLRLYFPASAVDRDLVADADAVVDPGPVRAAGTEGMITFDSRRIRLELVPAPRAGDDLPFTPTRFPMWGTAEDLIRILDVDQVGDTTYEGTPAGNNERRPVVEGSQMLGQSIVAASRHAPGRRVVSATLLMLRMADARQPLTFELRELTNGRTFTAVAVDVLQAGKVRASGTVLLDVGAEDLMRHETASPPVAGPEAAVPLDMSVLGRDLRVVDAAYTDDPDAPVGPPVIDAWVRFRDVPDDQPVHAALLAQFTGHMPIAAAMRPHAGIGQREAHRTLSTAINAITISFHADVDAADWLRYHHEATFAGAGMTHSTCEVRNRSGTLVASFTVDAMVRAMSQPLDQVDPRTAM